MHPNTTRAELYRSALPGPIAAILVSVVRVSCPLDGARFVARARDPRCGFTNSNCRTEEAAHEYLDQAVDAIRHGQRQALSRN